MDFGPREKFSESRYIFKAVPRGSQMLTECHPVTFLWVCIVPLKDLLSSNMGNGALWLGSVDKRVIGSIRKLGLKLHRSYQLEKLHSILFLHHKRKIGLAFLSAAWMKNIDWYQDGDILLSQDGRRLNLDMALRFQYTWRCLGACRFLNIAWFFEKTIIKLYYCV